jgi:hypothetical protein
MSRDSICDFVLSITTSNVVWWNKNVKTRLQEGVLKKRGVNNTKSLREACPRTGESSSPGDSHPQALTDPDVTVSCHPALIIQLPSLVDQTVRPDDPTPSLHLHYRDFNTTWRTYEAKVG